MARSNAARGEEEPTPESKVVNQRNINGAVKAVPERGNALSTAPPLQPRCGIFTVKPKLRVVVQVYVYRLPRQRNAQATAAREGKPRQKAPQWNAVVVVRVVRTTVERARRGA